MTKAGGEAGWRLKDLPRRRREPYRLAAALVPEGGWVLDIACGVGYGARMMAELARPTMVVGVDLAPEAIAYGIHHCAHPRVALVCADPLRLDLGTHHFDLITSFETVERVAQDFLFLSRLRRLLALGGTLVVSASNRDLMPSHAVRRVSLVHCYTSEQFADLLAQAGLALTRAYIQHDRERGDIVAGFGGASNIALCRCAADLADDWRAAAAVEGMRARADAQFLA